MIYLFHFCLLAIYGFVYELSPKSRTICRFFVAIFFLQTFLLYVLRSPHIGTDTYIMMKDYLYSNINFATKAPLYSLLKNFFHWFIPSGQGYMIMCGLFITGGTAYYIYRNSKNIVLSSFLFFALYFFFQSMNVARQFIAIVFVANGMIFIWEKRKWPAILLLVSALFIHSTAVMLMPLLLLLFITNIRVKKVFFLCYCIGLLCYEPLLHLFMYVFPLYTMYTESGMLFEVGQNRKILLTLFYICLLASAYIVYSKTKHRNTVQENNQWEFLLFCLTATVLIGFLALKSTLLTRIEYYFSFPLILFIPLILSKFKQNHQVFLQGTIYVITAVPGLFQFMANYGDIHPYLFFWE